MTGGNIVSGLSVRPSHFMGTTLCAAPSKSYDLSTNYEGWTGKDGSRPPPWVPLIKSYGSSILFTSLGAKTFSISLGLGGTEIKDPAVGATCPGYFTPPPPPPKCLQAPEAPALSPVRSPNNGKVGIKSFARTPGASGLILM